MRLRIKRTLTRSLAVNLAAALVLVLIAAGVYAAGQCSQQNSPAAIPAYQDSP